MVTIEQTRAGTGTGAGVEMVAGAASSGQGMPAPVGYPERDSMESMAPQQQPTGESATTPSYFESAWEFVCSMGEGFYNFTSSMWSRFIKFLGSFSAE